MDDSYEIFLIAFDYLNYRWLAPHFQKERRDRANELYNGWYEKLKNQEKMVGMKDRKIQLLYNNIKKHGMINPFIVKPASYSKDFDRKKYYVIIGNQRIVVLRALIYQNEAHKALGQTQNKGQWLVPCIIAYEDDSWGDDTFAINSYKAIYNTLMINNINKKV